MQNIAARDPRGELRDDEEAVRLMDHPDSKEDIPTLDMEPYLAGKPGGLQEVAVKLREISMTVGFFYLKNHSIPQNLIDRTFAEARRFHALPAEAKQKIPFYNKALFMIGYEGYEAEREGKSNTNIVSNTKPSKYAKFVIGREEGPQGEATSKVWPQNLPGFKETLLEYNNALEKLGRQFLPLWAEGLKLPHDYFDPFFKTPHLQLALLHYPPQKEIGNRQYGISPHTDNAMMTLLAQDEVGGLAVRMPSGHWRLVEPKPGTLVVNTGNSIVQWTNESYLSTKHRVINTNLVDRYSIPVFFGPSDDTIIAPLPVCTSDSRPALYKPIAYGDLRSWYYGEKEKM